MYPLEGAGLGGVQVTVMVGPSRVNLTSLGEAAAAWELPF